MDGERPHSVCAENPTRRQKTPPNGVALKRLAMAMSLDRTYEGVRPKSIVSEALRLPVGRVGQRARIPPKRNEARLTSLRPASHSHVRPTNTDDHIVESQPRDFGDAHPAAARKADNDQVAPRVG
jgi:hypothetical protein